MLCHISCFFGIISIIDDIKIWTDFVDDLLDLRQYIL